MINQKIGKYKYIIYQILSVYKFYKKMFFNFNFNWIESYACFAKITKLATNSKVIKVVFTIIRYFNRLSLWYMKVAGSLCSIINVYSTLNNIKKTLHINVLNLIIILQNHLDCSVELATKIITFCT